MKYYEFVTEDWFLLADIEGIVQPLISLLRDAYSLMWSEVTCSGNLVRAKMTFERSISMNTM